MVADGHGGQFVSQRAYEILFPIFLQRLSYLESVASEEMSIESLLSEVLQESFLDFHVQLVQCQSSVGKAGSTCTVALFQPILKLVVTANIGDAEVKVLQRGGFMKPLTQVHQFPNQGERIEVYRRHGKWIWKRLCCSLEVSRSFGDFELTEAWSMDLRSFELDGWNLSLPLDVNRFMASPVPEISCYYFNPETDLFLVMGSDGLYPSSLDFKDCLQGKWDTWFRYPTDSDTLVESSEYALSKSDDLKLFACFQEMAKYLVDSSCQVQSKTSSRIDDISALIIVPDGVPLKLLE